MRAAGLTLVELLVAMTLVLVMSAGALQLLARGRAAQRSAETVARLEEQARAALELVAHELRHAGYWGRLAAPAAIAGSTAAGAMAPAGLAVAGGCGEALALDLATPVAAANGAYAATADLDLGCAPSGRAAAGADTLTLRGAAPEAGAAAAGRLQLETRADAGRLFADGVRQLGPAAVVHDLAVSVFYVSDDSTGQRGLPALRRKRLVGGTRPAFQDEELVSGIADLQVELGVDAPGDGDRAVDAWLAPGATPAGTVRAVRVHLLAVAAEPEAAPIALPALAYADRVWPATQSRTRRLYAAQTVTLRNVGGGD